MLNLTQEGQQCADGGTSEVRARRRRAARSRSARGHTAARTHHTHTARAQFKVYSAVPEGDDGADMADLKASLGDAVVKIGMGAAMKNKWLRKEGTVLKRALAGVVDEVQAQLREIQLAFSLRTAPSVLTLRCCAESARTACFSRQHVSVSLYDRFHAQPPLLPVERRWAAYQLLRALAQCHARGESGVHAAASFL